MTTTQHLDSAVEHLESAVIEYLDAARSAEFFGWKQKHIERMDLIKRATARLRKDMLADAFETGQQELFEEVA